MNTRKRLVPLLLSLCLILAGPWIIPSGKAVAKTALLLPHVLTSAPSPLKWFSTPPIRETIRYPAGDAEVVAEVFRPRDDGRHGAIIFSLGVTANFEDPDLIRVAEGLARLGVVVMVPHSEDLAQGRLHPREADALVSAFKYLQTQVFVDPQRIGYAGFCVGSSLALVAAEDPRINAEVAFVSVVGGYYDIFDVGHAVLTQRIRYNGQDQVWRPARQTAEVFVRYLVDGVQDAPDRVILAQFLASGQLNYKELQALSPTSRLVYELLTAEDPEQTETLITQLPSDEVDKLRQLSPNTWIDRLRAKVFILQDPNDPFIPPSETWHLANSLPEDIEWSYAELRLFQHVRPIRPLDKLSYLGDVARLYRHLYHVMREVG